MNDKDLLELAAKAAGFGAPGSGAVCWTESEYPRGSGMNGALWNYVGHMDTAELWNPLTDDGDALRLAVKLKLTIFIESGAVRIGPGIDYPDIYFEDEDPCAVTRRAIVLTAAQLTRTTKPEQADTGEKGK